MLVNWGRGPFTAVVTPAPARDRNGDPVIPESSSDSSEGDGSWPVPNCKFAPGGTEEDNFQVSRVASKWKIYAPSGYAFPPDATVEIDGVIARVEGDPQRWGQLGQVVNLERIRG